MPKKKHWAIFIDNTSDKRYLVNSILTKNAPGIFNALKGKKGGLFSKLALERFIDEEDRHLKKVITQNTVQSLKSMSSGERKKALLNYILKSKPDFIVLDNPFDNLDIDAQTELKTTLQNICDEISLIQIASRKVDLLLFIESFYKLNGRNLVPVEDFLVQENNSIQNSLLNIPAPITEHLLIDDPLIELKNVDVSYFDNPVLKNINWKIKKGDFWELRGKNGSGKTTILSMITGENPKGYGQELFIFGRKKGSGESVWDIKKQIGYFTPAMTDKFIGYHSVENMIISGLNDSIGLYTTPTEIQQRTARAWLALIGMLDLKDSLFQNLSMGQKRLVMCARAMIKHPIILIFDEPTAGLDDKSAALFVSLVNKFASESETTIVFVSHRKEPNLNPDFIYELKMGKDGSTGDIK